MTRRVSARARVLKTAGLPFEDHEDGPGSVPVSSDPKRKIPKDHTFDPKALKPLTRALWALSVSLGHALTAHREFSRLKSASFSPDGMLGGRGYVMSIKDIRQRLFEAAEGISSICDTLHDEIHAPHWQSKLAELEKADVDDVERLLHETEENLEDPEGEAEEDLKAVEDPPGDPTASQMPGGEGEARHVETLRERQTKQASSMDMRWFLANSSLPVTTVPGGPRVDHLDRGDQTGPGGSYNTDEPKTQDDWGLYDGVQNQFLYSTPWQGDFHGEKAAESAIPDSNSDPTPTEAWDFGIGFGAKGQGVNYPPPNPGDPRSVSGPQSGLPEDPGGKTRGDGGSATMDVLDHATADTSFPVVAFTEMTEPEIQGWIEDGIPQQSVMPTDVLPPVARADYYRGLKDNDVNGATELPGDGQSDSGPEMDRDVMNTGYSYDLRQPHIKWDSSTKNYRPDPLVHREPVQGPYTHPLHP